MKKPQILRRFDDTISGVVLERQFSNKTPIAKSASYVSLICPVCGTGFTRKASEAKRHDVSYCGRGCAGVASRRQVATECKVCGKQFLVKQSFFGRITCCGDDCRRKLASEITTERNISGWEDGAFPVGENAPAAKLSRSQVDAILKDPRGHAEVARDYGVTRRAIRLIRERVTWARDKDAGTV